jgi:chemotaxis methyl-accepting protein methylase
MTKSNLKLNEILAAVDLNGKEVWDDLTEEQKKSVVFYTLNRYISSITGSREEKEHFVLLGNERFNKNLFLLLNKHPKLLWQLACSCGHESKKVFFHKWLKLNKSKNKKVEFLGTLFPNLKQQDLETMSAITTTKEIKEYCAEMGWDKKEINAIKL